MFSEVPKGAVSEERYSAPAVWPLILVLISFHEHTILLLSPINLVGRFL
jgi:hypothetical protein